MKEKVYYSAYQTSTHKHTDTHRHTQLICILLFLIVDFNATPNSVLVASDVVSSKVGKSSQQTKLFMFFVVVFSKKVVTNELLIVVVVDSKKRATRSELHHKRRLPGQPEPVPQPHEDDQHKAVHIDLHSRGRAPRRSPHLRAQRVSTAGAANPLQDIRGVHKQRQGRGPHALAAGDQRRPHQAGREAHTQAAAAHSVPRDRHRQHCQHHCQHS